VVRNERDVSKLEKISPLIGKCHKEGTLDFAVIPEFLAPNAILKILEGVTGIVHLASPLAAEVYILLIS
jgi:hypothetical protein